jgi:NTE family protein
MASNVGLVMTGGGARGAYQAGVLKRIGELRSRKGAGNPFPIIGGSSAGAINGSALAAGCDQFRQATKVIADLWASIEPSKVFRCDMISQATNSLTWIMDLSFGGLFGGGNARYLLDATPLSRFLSAHLNCNRIQDNIEAGHLYALAISATNYNSGKSYLFIHGREGHPMWDRSRRVTLSTQITVDHICASAAIPLVFQPVKLETELGTGYFGDGCIRLQQPLSPVIRLGAEKLVAISVRGENAEHREHINHRDPSLGEVLGVLFDVMFLDHLTADLEHLDRLNEMLSAGRIKPKSGDGCNRMRPLKYLLIAPSQRLSEVAAHHHNTMPYQIQYFVNSLGRDAASVSDLMSYLLFTSKYTRELIEIGYEDAGERVDEIEEFIYGGRQ